MIENLVTPPHKKLRRHYFPCSRDVDYEGDFLSSTFWNGETSLNCSTVAVTAEWNKQERNNTTGADNDGRSSRTTNRSINDDDRVSKSTEVTKRKKSCTQQYLPEEDKELKRMKEAGLGWVEIANSPFFSGKRSNGSLRQRWNKKKQLSIPQTATSKITKGTIDNRPTEEEDTWHLHCTTTTGRQDLGDTTTYSLLYHETFDCDDETNLTRQKGYAPCSGINKERSAHYPRQYTPEEDKELIRMKQAGFGWVAMSKSPCFDGKRSSNSLRQRWKNHVSSSSVIMIVPPQMSPENERQNKSDDEWEKILKSIEENTIDPVVL